MKKILFIVAFFATISVQYIFAQDISNQSQLSQLLHSYYDIKDALIQGNANSAAAKAAGFVKTLSGIDEKVIPEGTRNALLKDAREISSTKNIQTQREHLSTFSGNMFALAKAVKFTGAPVYYEYCPMKKAYWLSSEAAIKNPYFGNAMLTCGKVTETLK